MISVEEAQSIILSCTKDYGHELISFENALGRILAEDIRSDRDLPPFNRVTMDGIAIKYEAFEKGIRSFKIRGTQAAGEEPLTIKNEDECIEIMTGAALSETADTVIRYEDCDIKNGSADVLVEKIKQGQNIHYKGKDKKQNDVVAEAIQVINPALIGIASSVGAQKIAVKKLPKILIVSTGDELVEADKTPGDFQIRSSNKYVIQSTLQQLGVYADMMHIGDDKDAIQQELSNALQHYDVLILSGGVSKGKFDFVPEALEALSVKKRFHKVKQKPGKPFWFGTYEDKARVFAFPGNPVSAMLCLHRYFIPWLKLSLGVAHKKVEAILAEDLIFEPSLHYFLPVQLNMGNGHVTATPVAVNGSGDFANLLPADAFIELPAEESHFRKGEAFRVWLFDYV